MSRERIVTIARRMLSGELDIASGCAAVCRERVTLEDTDLQSELVLPFVAFDSEMHNFPVGESRKYWNDSALAIQDRRLKEIIEAAESEILDACRNLVARWS